MRSARWVRDDLTAEGPCNIEPLIPCDRVAAPLRRYTPGWVARSQMLGEKVVAAIKWGDGTVIDCVREMEIKELASGGGGD